MSLKSITASSVKLVKIFGLIALVFVSYLLLLAFAPSADASLRENAFWRDVYARGSSLDTWVNTENDIAVNRLLDNIAPGGQNAGGATPGTVLASPSRAHPNYYFQCKMVLCSDKTNVPCG